MSNTINIQPSVFHDFNTLLERHKAVASISRTSGNTSAFAVICTKFNGERFEDAVKQAILEEEAHEKINITKVDSFDYGYKVSVCIDYFGSSEDEEPEGGEEYELSLCTQY